MIKKDYSKFIKRINDAQKDFKDTVIKDLKELITKAIKKERLQKIQFTFYFDESWWFNCELTFKDSRFVISFDSESNSNPKDFPVVTDRPYTLEVCNILNDLFASEKIPKCLIFLGSYRADKDGFYFKGIYHKSEWEKGWN